MPKQIKRTILSSKPSYLDALPHGIQSSYLRAVVDAHLVEVRAALALLRRGRTREEVIDLLKDGALPAARIHETGLVALRPDEREALAALAWEEEATGLDPAALLAALDGGAGC